MKRLQILLLASTLVVILFLAIYYLPWRSNPNIIDFGQPWVAGAVLDSGLNPYDRNAFERVARNNNLFIETKIFYFFHPPNILFFSLLLAKLNYHKAALAWNIVNIISIILFVLITFLLFSHASSRKFQSTICSLAVGVLLIFSWPVFHTVVSGHRSLFVLACLSLSFALLELNRTRYDFFSGVIFSLALIKPNLLILTTLVYLGLSIQYRRLYMMIGLALGFIMQLAVVCYFSPSILFDYINSDQTGAIQFITPTVGGVMIYFMGASVAMRLVITFVFSAYYIMLTMRAIKNVSFLEALSLSIPISVFASPYAWSYDFVLIMIPIAYLVSVLLRQVQSCLLPLVFLGACYFIDYSLLPRGGNMFKAIYYIFSMNILLYSVWVVLKRNAIKPISNNI